MPRGRWTQQVVMTRNGTKHSRADNVASALNEDLKTSNESVIQRLYNKASAGPWIVSWVTCKQDSQRNFRSNFDGPPPDLAQIKDWQYFQSHVDPSTTLRCRFYTGPPGGPKSKPVRFCDHGEIMGP
eukprot:4794897-Pyramimonas_sp.AAC.1